MNSVSADASNVQRRKQFFLKRGADPDLLNAVPLDILLFPLFPYNADRTERWCYPCKRFKPVGEFHKKAGRVRARCILCSVLSPEVKRNRNLKQNYDGFTAEEYEAMLALQGGICAICGRPEQRMLRGKVAPLSIDHCHTTHKIRALLCGDCNISFGLMGESPERIKALLSYAERWQGV